MSWEAAVALFGLTFMLGVSPGPGLFAIIARCLAHGMWRTLPFTLGLIFGDLVYLVLAILGMSVVAQTLGPVFAVVKYAGAAYLIWLGVRTWRAHVTEDVLATPPAAATRSSLARAFLSGFALTLGNPKVILFYGAVLPSLFDVTQIHAGGLLAAPAVTFAGVFLGILPYMLAAERLRGVMRTPRARRRMNKAAGAVLVGAGGAVAAS